MKRDMDLIRLLLLQTESGEKPEAMDRYTEPEILYHFELGIEADLLDCRVVRGAQGDVVGASIRKLTWQGHEFLNSARDNELWNQAKKKAISTGGSWTLEGLKLPLFELVRRSVSGDS